MTELSIAMKEQEKYLQQKEDEEYRNKKFKLSNMTRKDKIKQKKNRSSK